MCNYELEAENNVLLDFVAACPENHVNFKMYFTVDLAFVHYFENWTDTYVSPLDLSVTEVEKYCL